MKRTFIGLFFAAIALSAFAADEKTAGDIDAIKARFDKEAAPYFTSAEKNSTLTKLSGGTLLLQPYTLVPMLEGIMIFRGEVFKSSNPELVPADAMLEEMAGKVKAAEAEAKKTAGLVDDNEARIAQLEKDKKDNQEKMMKEKDKDQKSKYNPLIFQAADDIKKLKKESKDLEKAADVKKKEHADILKIYTNLKTMLDNYNANQKKLGGGWKKDDKAVTPGKTADGKPDVKPDLKKDGNLDPFNMPKQ